MTRIKHVERLESTTLRLGGEGDNWHMSWADDGRQYVALCDGRGWADVEGYTGQSYNTRVYAIEGEPPDISFVHLPGFPDLLIGEPPDLHRYYGFGILALDGCIYHYLSTPNHIFSESGARFIGAKLVYSPDAGRTWCNQDGSTPVRWEPRDQRSRGNMLFFEEPGESFTLITVLQMGQNYEHNRDGYVYLYSPNGNTEGTMNELVLARVPKDRILDRVSYEFFSGRDGAGRSTWSSDIQCRAAVHTFVPGWVNVKYHPYAWHPSVVYNAALGVYMMTNWGMGIDANGDSDEPGMWFRKPSYLGVWEAQAPEGPWTQVYEEEAWMPTGDAGAHAYQPQISPQWIAPDGKSLWLVWTDFQDLDGEKPYYAFNLQKVRIDVD
ncbi:MAG: hypothetical protein QF785_02365 [Phycisphaeraceae bacterium]|nr:hypothetical protein [Phycisphaeraceae bacterium]